MGSRTCWLARCAPGAHACGEAMFHGTIIPGWISNNNLIDGSHEDCTPGQPSVLEPQLPLPMSYKRTILLRNLARVINVFKFSTKRICSTKRTQPSDFLNLPAELRVKIHTDIVLAASRCSLQKFGHDNLSWIEDSDSLDLPSDLNPAHAAVRRYEDVPGLHALRLTCRRFKDELDYEIVRHVVLQVKNLLRDLETSVGRLHGLLLHMAWIDRSLTRRIPNPRAFKDVQNFRITGRLQNIYKLVVFRDTPHRSFLRPPSPLPKKFGA